MVDSRSKTGKKVEITTSTSSNYLQYGALSSTAAISAALDTPSAAGYNAVYFSWKRAVLLEKLRHTITCWQMFLPGERVLVAVSGGPDSVALCHLLRRGLPELRLDLVAAYIHHGLRGAEADEDARFVQNLGRALEVPVVTRHLDVGRWQARYGGSLQMAARTLRYRCLRQIMAEAGATKLALGHNADDQAEEILLRLFRGTGPHGLTGMPAARGVVARPLLECHRHEILDYLHEHGLSYRRDSSNLRPWCQRNLLRLKWLPCLQRDFNSNLNATLLRTSKILQEEEDFWKSLLEAWLERHLRRDGQNAVRIPIAPLLETHAAMQRRLLRLALEEVRGQLQGLGFHHIEALIRLCRSEKPSAEAHLPGMVTAMKDYGWLTIGRRPGIPERIRVPISGPGLYEVPGLGDTIQLEEETLQGNLRWQRNPAEEVMDRDRICFPLILRSFEPGDRFRPLGMGGSKKVKDFFVDARVPRSRRHLVPLLCSREHILWVVGHRLDDRVKVTGDSKRLLRVRYWRASP